MNLAKSYEFFNPTMLNGQPVHIIGCGAVGGDIATTLARYGITKMTLYDFDHVEDKNIANQVYRVCDIHKPKVEVIRDMICEINPDAKYDLKIEPEGYTDQPLSGYVFLCVDSIDVRRKIAKDNQFNSYIKAMFDVRMRLSDAQAYAADWASRKQIKNFLDTMNFSQEEADAENPVSACNVVLSSIATVRVIDAFQIENFIRFVKEGKIANVILTSNTLFDVQAMSLKD